MKCVECGYVAKDGDYFYDTDDGYLCDECVDGYLQNLKESWEVQESDEDPALEDKWREQ